MEKQRKSVGWRRNSVSLRPRRETLHRPKFWAALTTEDVSLRLPPSLCFSHSLFISVSCVNFVSDNLTLSAEEQTVLLVFELGPSNGY